MRKKGLLYHLLRDRYARILWRRILAVVGESRSTRDVLTASTACEFLSVVRRRWRSMLQASV